MKRHLIHVLSLTALLCSATTTGAVLLFVPASGADEPTQLRLAGGVYPMSLLERDSDDDGWTDWVELQQGTDPQDSSSHPSMSVTTVVDGRAFTQYRAFPDTLVTLELASLPPSETLIDQIGTVVGLSPNGRLHKELTDRLTEFVGSDVLAHALAAADKGHESLGSKTSFRTNGMWGSLISDGFSDHPSAGVGVGSSGRPYLVLDDGNGNIQKHSFGIRDTYTTTWHQSRDGDGNEVVECVKIVNGGIISSTKSTRRADGGVDVQEFDAGGNLVASYTTYPDGSGQSTKPSGEVSSAQPSDQPSGKETPTDNPTYVNPDDDQAWLIPSQQWVKERIEFLSGLNARFGSTPIELDPAVLTSKPGVADPAEPGCEDKRCVVFVEVSQPDVHNTAGGDPVNPDWWDGRPGNLKP